MTFGKLSDPVEFRTRPYEDCLSGMSVTHYPRYSIDMELAPAETIHAKTGTTYDDLRLTGDPVKDIITYYKSNLNNTERLWWAGEDVTDIGRMKVRLASTLTVAERKNIIEWGLHFFLKY